MISLILLLVTSISIFSCPPAKPSKLVNELSASASYLMFFEASRPFSPVRLHETADILLIPLLPPKKDKSPSTLLLSIYISHSSDVLDKISTKVLLSKLLPLMSISFSVSENYFIHSRLSAKQLILLSLSLTILKIVALENADKSSI